jgi:hypothetical protein
VRGKKVGLCNSEDWGSKSTKNNNEPRCGIISAINPRQQLLIKDIQTEMKNGSTPSSFIIVSQLTYEVGGSYLKIDGSVLRGITSLCLNNITSQSVNNPSLSYLLQEETSLNDMTKEEIQEIILSKLGSNLIGDHQIDDVIKEQSPPTVTEGSKDYQILKSHIEGYQTQYFNEAGFYVPTPKFIKEIEGIFSKMNPEDAEDMLNRLTANLKDSNKT